MLSRFRRQEILVFALTALLDRDRLESATKAVELTDAEMAARELDKKYGRQVHCRDRVISNVEEYEIEQVLAEIPTEENGVVILDASEAATS